MIFVFFLFLLKEKEGRETHRPTKIGRRTEIEEGAV